MASGLASNRSLRVFSSVSPFEHTDYRCHRNILLSSLWDATIFKHWHVFSPSLLATAKLYGEESRRTFRARLLLTLAFLHTWCNGNQFTFIFHHTTFGKYSDQGADEVQGISHFASMIQRKHPMTIPVHGVMFKCYMFPGVRLMHTFWIVFS